MNTFPLPASSSGTSAEFNRFVKKCQARGIDFSGMQRAQAVELSIGGGGLEAPSGRLAGDVEIERLEGTIEARPIAKPVGRTKLRYFLDGAQQTLPAGRLGYVPIYRSLTAAGILERDDSGNTALMRDSLHVASSWIVPRGIESDDIRFICDGLESLGGQVVDPLAHLLSDRDAYLRAASDYVHLEQRSMSATNDIREGIESALLKQWVQRPNGDEDWIVVDGQLRTPVANAVGLVKSFTYQYVTGGEAAVLFSLPSGQRSSAFVSANQYRERSPDNRSRTLWYLRFHPSAGLDARHGLIRLEAAPEFVETERIDELSGWLLAERAPRASADARWDSLIYPIHLLERILKRRLASETVAWPGARH